MQSFNIPDAKAFCHAVAIQHREPVFLSSSPGVGKTALVTQLVADIRGVLCDVRLGQYDSVDLRGFPAVENGLTTWYAPRTLPFEGNDAFPDDVPIVLFLDELNSATQAVFAVSMQLINERRIGEHVLKPNVYIIAAGNRQSDRGVANRMPTTVANRLTHLEVVVDVSAYCEYRQAKGCAPVEVAFYHFRKDLLNTFDPSKPDLAFATPRTSEKAWSYYADASMPEKIKVAAMAGAIGDGVTAEIWGFIDVWSKVIPIAEIMAAPETCRLPSEASMQYATAVNVSSHMTKTTTAPLHKYLCRMPPEFTVMAWQLAGVRDHSVYESPAFLDFGKRFKAVFNVK